MITSIELRQKFFDFFISKGHKLIASSSVLPENDSTVLFTTAGMQPLVPYLLGDTHPEGKRLVSSQKCIRTGDINEVGDSTHATFFEMLGNWSLGDYFKEDSIAWSFEFLTGQKWLGLDVKKIAVTVFAGDDDIDRDIESAKLWKNLGISDNKIAYLGKEDNWWPAGGKTAGPQGPDTEIFWWSGEAEYPSDDSNPATDPENWMEIWNNVFMQFNKTEEGKYEFLKQKNVDTGMGLERTLATLNGFSDVFQTDTFRSIIYKIEELSGYNYTESIEITKSMRIIADHLRAATIIIGDDGKIAPSNVDQGYIARRLIRRAIRHGRLLGLKENFCTKVAEEVVSVFKNIYPEVMRNHEFIMFELAKEESKFRNTIEQGLKEFSKLIDGFRIAFEKMGEHITEISGKKAFKLYDTYGFPLEMTLELATENNLTVDVDGFEHAFKIHQELSRVGADQKFKGGLADNSEMSKKYHTATHLLHASLKAVLGDHVIQRGSNITSERLRFDFTHPEKLTGKQKEDVENRVNYAIRHDYNISSVEMTVDEARDNNAIGIFNDKYGAKVKVYSIGDPNKKPSAHENSLTFSREICGGPHVANTSVLGKFRIRKEESVSSGVRRIKAVLE